MQYETTVERVSGCSERINSVVVNGESLECLCSLTSRAIFTDAARSIVVKVDRGRAQADHEADLWDRLDEEDRPYFAPVLAHGEGWVIQKFVNLDKSTPCDKTYKKALSLFEKYEMMTDWQGWAQFGLDTATGMLCIHDYGIGPDN